MPAPRRAAWDWMSLCPPAWRSDDCDAARVLREGHCQPHASHSSSSRLSLAIAWSDSRVAFWEGLVMGMPRWRRLILSAAAAMFLSGGIFIGELRAPAPTQASHYCYVSTAGTPYRISGPVIRGYGDILCTEEMWAAEVHVAIQMKGGNCSNWCQVAYAEQGCRRCLSTPTAYATSGACSGTKQYRTGVQAWWSYGAWHQNFTSWYYTSPVTISC
jgi:hypothetical protein